MKNTPRVINDFEGGPSQIYLGKHPWISSEENRRLVFNIIAGPLATSNVRDILKELKTTPTLESISRLKQLLYKECEECEECDPKTCPKSIGEVGEKGSGMEITEILEDWFIDLGKCESWKVCECCNGKGYLD